MVISYVKGGAAYGFYYPSRYCVPVCLGVGLVDRGWRGTLLCRGAVVRVAGKGRRLPFEGLEKDLSFHQPPPMKEVPTLFYVYASTSISCHSIPLKK